MVDTRGLMREADSQCGQCVTGDAHPSVVVIDLNAFKPKRNPVDMQV